MKPWKPTKDQLRAATTTRLRDVIAPDLRVLFCGINPGLYSAAIGCHFGRPGNLFWPTLHRSGFTPRLFSPFEQHLLLDLGLGLTNFVPRSTATADELSPDEIRAGVPALRRKALKYRPRYIAVLGYGAYRTAFDRPKATVGLQPDRFGDTQLYLLPNPSGLNAHHQPPVLAAMFSDFRQLIDHRQG